MPWTHRFISEFLRADPRAVEVTEVGYARNGVTLPARAYRPARHRGSLPAWAVLHGLTRTGREHAGLDRFARAYAAAGNLVFVPDVPEWRELRVAPAITADTIRAAVRAVQARDDVRHGHVGLLAFSFGATQAVMAGADPEMAELLHGIVGWGGYSDLHAAFRFGMTGIHELGGVRQRIEPDPYGMWIIAGNYLTAVPEYRDHGDLADALQSLALEAGVVGAYAWDPIYDPSKARLRAGLAPERQELFDYFAPPSHAPKRDEPRARELARQLADAAIRQDPELDPVPVLPHLQVPVLLAHGRDDRLIPYSESLRLCELVPKPQRRGCVITGLFAHSGGTLEGMNPFVRAREAARFARLLHRILNLV